MRTVKILCESFYNQNINIMKNFNIDIERFQYQFIQYVFINIYIFFVNLILCNINKNVYVSMLFVLNTLKEFK